MGGVYFNGPKACLASDLLPFQKLSETTGFATLLLGTQGVSSYSRIHPNDKIKAISVDINSWWAKRGSKVNTKVTRRYQSVHTQTSDKKEDLTEVSQGYCPTRTYSVIYHHHLSSPQMPYVRNMRSLKNTFLSLA